MKPKSAPAIPLFGDAYLADTRHLSLEEHGAYLQLLMIAWRTDGCRLPDDDVRLARMLGVTGSRWAKLKPTVMAFWSLEEGFWTQGRLTKERAFVEEKRAKNSAAADARWNGQATENKQSGECERISERNAPPPPPPQEEVMHDATHHVSVRQPLAEAFEFYNENAVAVGWPVARKLSGSRPRNLGARLRDEGLEGWKAGVIRARASPFLARSPPPEFFNFDWLVKQANFLKVTEGNYDRDRQPNSRQGDNLRGSRPNPAFDMLGDALADLAAGNDPEGDCGTWPAVPAGGRG